ncbi:BA14K family protein [Neorhizobium sp. P12A]|nr:BA14K family protein [Neorhizobium sp. P12A]
MYAGYKRTVVMKSFTRSIVIGGLTALIGLSAFAEANAAAAPQLSAQPGTYNGYNGRGAWLPPAAAQTSGTTVASASGHASWCATHYRTYRASDNTYKPLDGPREQCR